MTQRYHALDSLRATMMLLGIALHAGINYIHTVLPIYFFKDERQSVVMDILVFVIHTFRMPTFFVMAGFFAAMLLIRRGKQGMLINRCKRIALPFAVFWPVMLVLYGLIFLSSIHLFEYGHWGIELALSEKYLEGSEPPLSTMHLWFLYYLMLFYLLFIPLSFILEKMPALGSLFDRVFRFLLHSPLGVIVLTAPIAVVGYFYADGLVEVDALFIPDPAQLLYHGIFFVSGWYLYKNSDCLDYYRRHWKTYTLLALVMLLITLVAFGFRERGYAQAQYAIAAFNNLATWLCVFALIGIFERFFASYSPTWRYLTDSSYWVYLIHIVFTMLFAVALMDMDWPAEAKFLVVCLLTLIVCYSSYHLLVRRSFIGLLLNGKKY